MPTSTRLPVRTTPDLPYEVKRSPIHGRGLFATRRIKKGELIGVYDGPRTRRNGPHVLWMEDDDGTAYGINGRNALRYVNHALEANADFEGPELVALRAIRPGEEITHHYGDDWI